MTKDKFSSFIFDPFWNWMSLLDYFTKLNSEQTIGIQNSGFKLPHFELLSEMFTKTENRYDLWIRIK